MIHLPTFLYLLQGQLRSSRSQRKWWFQSWSPGQVIQDRDGRYVISYHNLSKLVFHLGRFETLLRKHGVPLTVLEVEPRGRRLHWHQGRHLCNFETVVIHSFDWLGQLHTGNLLTSSALLFRREVKSPTVMVLTNYSSCEGTGVYFRLYLKSFLMLMFFSVSFCMIFATAISKSSCVTCTRLSRSAYMPESLN